jgi:tRNA pseudouridine13 synthase
MSDLPRALSDLDPAPGVIKADYEDFVVDEVPLYEFSGRGTHTYFCVEKAGLSTVGAAQDIARALGMQARDVGFAGLKDARAVTRQWFSIEHLEPERLRALDIPRIRILDITRHTNKLKQGHLKENRFQIRVRETHTHRAGELRAGLERLAEHGVPNYFGRQRFGGRGDTWVLGRAILKGDVNEAIDCLLGRPSELDYGEVARARRLYEQGQYQQASRIWPGMFRTERFALKALARSKGNRKRAYYSINKQARSFYVSAYQSYLFNNIVARRVETGLHRLMAGDLAWRHANEAVFKVEHADEEQPRADAFEISPSGPIFGFRMSWPDGEPGEMERRLYENEHLSDHSFRSKGVRAKGARRPLRFQLREAQLELGADDRGAYLELRFSLPRGCYATSVLRELFTDAVELEPSASPLADETG